MNISRFFGATNREAMRQVRLALGPDALIISNRRVNGGVEIMATDQTVVPEAAISAPPAAAVPARPAAPTPAPTSAPAAPGLPPNVSPADLMQALGSMRGLLESGFDEIMWGAQLRKAPQAVSLFQRLLALGFSTALLRAMLKRLPATTSMRVAIQWCRSELIENLPVLADEDELWTPGAVLALVGPTGVGKTTTIAKLAARCVKRFGAANLMLITTDTYRIGAHEQLSIYGRKMGVAVHVAQDHGELVRLIGAAEPNMRVLIDNVGISQRDRHVKEQAAMLENLGRPVKRLLVLNAASQGDTLDEVARAYTHDGGTRPVGCIITKLDESPRVAPALDVAIRFQLPIHYASTGQKVPEDLACMDAQAWIDLSLAPATKHASPLFAPSAADLAALMESPYEEEAKTQAATARRASDVLPGLLALAGTGSAMPDEATLRSACNALDASEVYASAYRLWCQLVDGSHKADIWRPLALARQEQSLLGQDRTLAVHDAVGVFSASSPRTLRATVLLGEEGRALTTPWQLWRMGGGWQATDGSSGAESIPAADVLRRQIDYFSQTPGSTEIVHLFTSPGQMFLRELLGGAATWLAYCTGSTRVEVDACMTTVAAHAKTVDYRSFNTALAQLRPGSIQGIPAQDVALWAAWTPVMINRRGLPSLSLLQLCVRLVDRRDGKPIKRLYGLCDPAMQELGLDTLAAWLTLYAEVRTVSRNLPAWLTLLEQRAGAVPLGDRAAAAVQMALASWQAVQSDKVLLTFLHQLVGPQGLKNPARTASALARLFVVKNLAQT